MCHTEREDVSINGSEDDGGTCPLAPPELLNLLLYYEKKQQASMITGVMGKEITGLGFKMKCYSN